LATDDWREACGLVTSHSENARQWVHIGSAGFALLLRVLTWWQAAFMAALALAINLVVLPRIGGRRLYRPVDEARGFPLGILLYPLSVLLLILTFPTRLDIVAAAWGILAFGDGGATLIGRRIGGRQLPWNPEKTLAGTIGFVLCGGAGAIALAGWTRPAVVPQPSIVFLVAASVAAAIAAGLVESIPVRLDDNLSVPAAAGAVLWLASLVTPGAAAASRDQVLAALPWALGVNVAAGWAGYRARTVSASGAVGGAIIGAIIYAAGGAPAWTLLFVTFLVASLTSRLGLQRKVLLGIAEERGGHRGAANAFANCGVAAVASLAAVTTPYTTASLLAFTAALTAGGSDTVASEIGKAWGRLTFLVSSLRRVKPGTPGAMSLEGTAAGIVAALALAAVATWLGLIASGLIVTVVISATVGALIESVLGATLERPGILNNDMLNFINTGVAAVVALTLA
jgi:uncharacterized protein (TIGR00297 family)